MRLSITCATILSVLTVTSCSVNPATGKRQLMLVSESQAIALGQQNDQAIVAEMGTYEDEELGRYVDGIGQRMAALSERPHLEWTFRVMDDPVVNAFALPGGYIYITRGILAHFNNEAELASVVGHEIGHVTGRHSANQLSKQQIAQIGLMGGMIANPELMQRIGDPLQSVVGLGFLKFSRDHERQADDLGLRYLIRAGYDPSPMADVFDTLARVSAAAGAERVPGWMSTHPVPENRRERIREQIRASGAPTQGTVERERFMARIDGMVFGEDPRQGFFEGPLFLHPTMEFQIELPPGWKTQNTRSAVVGQSPESDAILVLTLAAGTSARDAFDKFFESEAIVSVPPAMGAIHGMPTAGAGFRADTGQGIVQGRVAFVEYGGRVFQIYGYTPDERWASREPEIRATLASFDRLRDARAKNVQPARIRIVRPARSMSLEEFAERYRASVPAATLALINRLDEGEGVQGGVPYKTVQPGS